MTLAIFNLSGTVLVEIDKLNIIVRGFTISLDTLFIMKLPYHICCSKCPLSKKAPVENVQKFLTASN